MSTGSFHFTQNHQLPPSSTAISVCCFSAAAARPAGEERRLLVVSDLAMRGILHSLCNMSLFIQFPEGFVSALNWVSIMPGISTPMQSEMGKL